MLLKQSQASVIVRNLFLLLNYCIVFSLNIVVHRVSTLHSKVIIGIHSTEQNQTLLNETL